MTIVDECALVLSLGKYGASPLARLPDGKDGITLQLRRGREQALELARMGGALLRLVNVQPVVPATFMEYVPVDFDQEQAKRATDALDAILAGVDLPAERKSAAARAGGIYHELLQEAAEWSADLIVVGSHRPVMSDYLLGSNAKTIVRHAQCSVLVVRE